MTTVSEWKAVAQRRILSGEMTAREWDDVLSALLHCSEHDGLRDFEDRVDEMLCESEENPSG